MVAHGKNDQVVPISNAIRLIEKVKSNKKVATLIDDSGHRYNHTEQLIDWLKATN